MSWLTDFQNGLDSMDVDEPWQPGEGAGIESPRQGAWDDVPVMGMIPDVGKAELVPQNQNAAQAWKQNPGNLGGAAQVQQRNREMLKPKTDTTSRYYTRQLYREMTKSRDPETRMQGRLGLRIRGADPNAGRDQMVSNRTALGQRSEAWNETFPVRPGQKASPEGISGRAGTPENEWRKLFPEAERRNLPSPVIDRASQTANLKSAEDFIDSIINRNLTQRT